MLLLMFASLLLPSLQVPPAAASDAAVAPLPGPVVRHFDPPEQPWLAGHRGVDLLGAPGAAVVAAKAGRVVFAGQVAGRGVVVVAHGELRTTYLPVRPRVRIGDAVAAGETIGTLETGHQCVGGTCLHWGLKRGETYLDPLSLLDPAEVRLLPTDAAARAAALARARTQAIDTGDSVPGVLARPVPGGIGSKFGRRFHPIFHVWRLHNGVDLHAGCGEPIHAAAAGRVSRVSYDSGSGHRLEIDHGKVGGRRLVTIYMHATGYSVKAGQRVRSGEAVGRVGSTGWSTGCHLHFTVKLNGRYADPERFLK